MNRKIMMSGLSIISALTLLGGTAFAAFSSSASATNNTFSTGTENLRISSNGTDFFPTIDNPFHATNITPGYSQTFNFWLQNNGTDKLDVVAHFDGSSQPLDGVLVTDFDCDNGANPGAFNVTDMKAGSVNMGSLNPAQTTLCHITVSLPSSVDNSYSGGVQSIFNAIFDGTQVIPAQ